MHIIFVYIIIILINIYYNTKNIYIYNIIFMLNCQVFSCFMVVATLNINALNHLNDAFDC